MLLAVLFLLAAFVSLAESILGMSQQRLIMEPSELQMAASSLSSGWVEQAQPFAPPVSLHLPIKLMLSTFILQSK